MSFRPFPVLTALTLPALAFLIWLGSWQLDRRAWKADLVAQYTASADGEPVGLNAAFCSGEPLMPGTRFDRGAAAPGASLVKIYGIDANGVPGWRMFALAALPDCADSRHILMEVRFDPLETARQGGDGRTASVSYVDAWRFEPPLGAGPFTPTATVAKSEFYAFDQAGMEDALALDAGSLNGQWWIARDDGALPAYLTATPPERHVGYAVTWFLMTLALIAIYVLFHVRAGRLRVGR